MNKKVVGVIIIGLVLVVGLLTAIYVSQSGNSNDSNNATSEQSANNDYNFAQAKDLPKSEAPEYLRAESGTNIRGQAKAVNQQKVAVKIGEYFYSPSVLTVSVGTTVTWVNTGVIGHTVTSEKEGSNQVLKSSLLNKGDTYSYTFEKTGTYNYFCVPHPTAMKGVVKVVQ